MRVTGISRPMAMLYTQLLARCPSPLWSRLAVISAATQSVNTRPTAAYEIHMTTSGLMPRTGPRLASNCWSSQNPIATRPPESAKSPSPLITAFDTFTCSGRPITALDPKRELWKTGRPWTSTIPHLDRKSCGGHARGDRMAEHPLASDKVSKAHRSPRIDGSRGVHTWLP